mgnify:CR=1 FL=1
MPLPSAWLDHLFGRLSVRYGAAFTRQWPDVEIAAVKADWGDVLDGTSGDAISYALRYLPATPCNAMQFRDLCRRAPVATQPALTDGSAKADPARVRREPTWANLAQAPAAGATEAPWMRWRASAAARLERLPFSGYHKLIFFIIAIAFFFDFFFGICQIELGFGFSCFVTSK